VEFRARDAFERGYEQIFIQDAMAALNEDAQRYPCKNIFPRMGRMRSTAQLLPLRRVPP
jgi:nicotinamidase-related amidase